MAEKPGPDLTPEQEIGVLLPEHTLTIQGRPIALRELSFRQGLQLAVPVGVLVQGIADRLLQYQDQPPASYFDELMQIFAAHMEETQQVMAACCGEPLDWVRELNDADGQAVLLGTWLVNKDFFFRRLQTRVLAGRLGKAAASPSPRSSVH